MWVRFRLSSDMKHYVLSSGIHVAQEFGFDKPTGMILYYEEGTRKFTMLHESLYPPPNMCPKTKYVLLHINLMY
jgi:hypothetical protein